MKLKNLFNYIQTADRDSTGLHYPFHDCGLRMHIYQGYKQVNIAFNNVTLYNLVFKPEYNEVRLFMVSNEIADYSNPITLDDDNDVSSLKLFMRSKVEIDSIELICNLLERN